MNWYTSDLPRRIARSYDAARHNPTDSRVAAAYRALCRETETIFAGLPLPVLYTARNPYASAREMFARIERERVLYVFTGGEPPRDHPLHGEINLKFRAIHDWHGHFLPRNDFTAQGEEQSYLAHRGQFSPLATLALATETRGQNCWNNFGSHLLVDATDAWEYARLPENRPFAAQKACILPQWAIDGVAR